MFGFRQRSLHAWPRRLQRWWVNRFTRYASMTQRVYRVTIRDHHFKRIIMADSHQSQGIAKNLGAFADTEIFPRLVFSKERELWVEFIAGRALDRVDAEAAEQVARLLATVNGRRPRCVPLDDTPYLHALRMDLRFLEQVGVLGGDAVRDLVTRAEACAPPHVWIGYDYTDPILKNFVRADDGRLVAVDVESLDADQLIGTGAAKACVRWLGPHRDLFLATMRDAGAPDFQSYLSFVELHFLAYWTKASFLEGKHRYVDSGLFEPFRAQH